MRKKIVAGNWKMNTRIEEAERLVTDIVQQFQSKEVELILAPPFTHLYKINEIVKGSSIKLSAQNISNQNFGAYTGEIAAEMVADLGCEYTIIGHSERRQYYGETDSILMLKVNKALSVGLKPIFCVGEVLEERENDQQFNIIQKQLEKGLFSLDATSFSNIVLAYEPVWAIGTGKTASPEQAQEVHQFIRKLVAKQYGSDTANNLSILYGGSCKPDNAQELFKQADIDGGLIGGAALNAKDFIAIAESFIF